jgi:hypothetical protein
VQALLAAARERLLREGSGASWRRPALSGLAVLLVLIVLVEGRGLPFDPFDDQAQPEVDDPPVSVAAVAAPQLHLPADLAEHNRRYLLWSTDGFPEIANGRASTVPDSFESLVADMDGFPDRATVERLREFGIASVVLHSERAAGSPQGGAAAKSVAGLGLSRRELPGGLVVYELRSPNAGSAPSGAGAG